MRQTDEAFSSLLNRVRVNNMTDADKSLLNSRYVKVSEIDYAEDALIVTATRKKCSFTIINLSKLSRALKYQ